MHFRSDSAEAPLLWKSLRWAFWQRSCWKTWGKLCAVMHMLWVGGWGASKQLGMWHVRVTQGMFHLFIPQFSTHLGMKYTLFLGSSHSRSIIPTRNKQINKPGSYLSAVKMIKLDKIIVVGIGLQGCFEKVFSWKKWYLTWDHNDKRRQPCEICSGNRCSRQEPWQSLRLVPPHSSEGRWDGKYGPVPDHAGSGRPW